jgi:hypothetical protein
VTNKLLVLLIILMVAGLGTYAFELHRKNVARRLRCEKTVEAEDRMIATEVATLEATDEKNRNTLGEVLQDHAYQELKPAEDALMFSNTKLDEAKKQQKALTSKDMEHITFCEAETD